MEPEETLILEQSLENNMADENHVENVQESFSNEEKTEAMEKSFSWSDICRVCANSDNHIIPIFEAEGAEHGLSDKIHKYLPIQVAITDTLPTQLCYHCAATILAWDELLNGCLEAEKQLLQLQAAYPLSSMSPRESTETKYNEISTEDLIDDPEPIPIEKQEPPVGCQLEEDPEQSNVGDEATKRFRKAAETFKLYLDKQNRYRNSRRVQNEVREGNFYPTENAMWQEVSCKREENPLTYLESPELENEDLDFRMEGTNILRNKDQRRAKKNSGKNKNFDNSQVVDSGPKNSQEIRNATIKCNISSEAFAELNDFEDDAKGHKDTSDLRKPYNCDECSKSFRLRDSLIRHQRIHRDERPFTCHICGKQFRDSGGLSRHLKDVHAKLKNFTCDICSNSFSSKATRDDHRRTHTGERPYNCDNCKKSFKSRACLYIHSKLHTNEFPYPCAHCSKKFRRRQEMLVHVSTHTGEKNYSCDICSRRFRVKTEVARHKLTHSEEKPYVCAKCGLSFRQNRYLNNHVKSRHPQSSND